ncbi:Mariner Mos1 transposase [Araneus ventricosus]|uniref:Mariner Mos1 transposase n=1 Tax=Araneus ventricosus TaxID=182803 RepID=A0A4Y2RJT2_ARAVE|nr:Mariner Mos1 transposase [Araneus ventricosus]
MHLRQALKRKRVDSMKRHDEGIFQHENVWPHIVKEFKQTLGRLHWDVLPLPPYSPDVVPFDYHLFLSMSHGLSGQRFHSYEDTKIWVNPSIFSEDVVSNMESTFTRKFGKSSV